MGNNNLQTNATTSGRQHVGYQRCAAALLVLGSSLLQANAAGMQTNMAPATTVETSWFEIELLAFSRNHQQRLLEQFPEKARLASTLGSVDLQSPLYQTDLSALLGAAPGCVPAEVKLPPDPSLTLALTANQDKRQQLVFSADAATLAEWQFLQYQPKLTLGFDGQLPQLCPTAFVDEPARGDFRLPGAVVFQQQPPALLPLTPAGQEQHQQQPYLAPASALQMQDLAYQLKHRANHQLLLHTAWRQPLSSKRQAATYRWYGGSNYGERFNADGSAKVQWLGSSIADPQQQLVAKVNELENALNRQNVAPLAQLATGSAAPSGGPVWQLDGVIKVWSERMLFAESAFNLRRLSADGSQLTTYYSQDQSRLLIGEIHYLDHPHLGLVLQIRRFSPPQVPLAPEDLTGAAAGTTEQ